MYPMTDGPNDPFENEDGDQEEITVDQVLKSVTKVYNETVAKNAKAAVMKGDIEGFTKIIQEAVAAEGTKKCHACERELQLGMQYNSWTADKLLCFACAKKFNLEIAPVEETATVGDTPVAEPETAQPEATIDDIIHLMQTGQAHMPVCIPEPPKKIVITSEKGDETVATVSKSKKVTATPLYDTLTFKTLKTPEKIVKKPGAAITVTPKTSKEVNTSGMFVIPLPPGECHGFTNLTVYTNPAAQAKAMGEWDVLPTKYLFLSYNVAMATVVNGREEPIRVYFVNGYDDFTGFLLNKGDTVEFGKNLDEKMKHVIQTSAAAPEIDDFKFLKTWMPV